MGVRLTWWVGIYSKAACVVRAALFVTSHYMTGIFSAVLQLCDIELQVLLVSSRHRNRVLNLEISFQACELKIAEMLTLFEYMLPEGPYYVM